MAIKELQTRIALKYDLYSAWTTAPGKDLVLLKGEIGICEIPSANAASNVAPTVLFKVGDGVKTFENLPWASAKAADVYSWAKASDVTFADGKITFVGGAADGSDKILDLNSFATDAEVEEIRKTLAAADTALSGRVEALEAHFGDGDGSVADDIAEAVAAEAKLREDADKAITDSIGTVTEGKTVVEMISDAQTAATTAGESAASAVQDNLNTHVQTYNGKVAELEQEDSRLAGLIGDANGGLTKAIADEKSRAEGQEAAIRGEFAAADTALKTELQGYADQAEADAVATAKSYTDTEVKKATDAAATNASEITRVEGLVTAEATARENADKAIDERLDAVEAFFATAEGETLDGALDTLKEIQDYLNGEGSATDGLIGRISTAETDIDNLQKEFADGGRVKVAEGEIDTLQSEMEAVEGRADKLEGIVDGYGAEGDTYATVAAHIAAVSVRAEKGITDAATADGKAVQAQNEVDALEGVVATLRGEYDVTKQKALDNESAISTANGKITALEEASAKHALAADLTALTGRVTTAEGNINTAAGNISSLQTLTGEHTTKIGNLEAAVGAATDEAKADGSLYARVKKNAADISTNKSDIADVKAVTDAYTARFGDADTLLVFQCGSSTVNTEAPAKA